MARSACGTKRQKECSGAALQDVHALLCRLIEEFSPTVMAVESVFTALNMRTALRLAEVRGVVLLAAAQHGVTVHSYSPREVKATVAGYGHADKRQMQLMVRALLSMAETAGARGRCGCTGGSAVPHPGGTGACAIWSARSESAGKIPVIARWTPHRTWPAGP